MTSEEYTNFKYKNDSQLLAMMAMADINVLNISVTDTVEFQKGGGEHDIPAYMVAAVVEYKWWYGPSPSESRWQRIPVIYCDFSCTPFHDRERDLHKHILCTVAGIRDEIEDQTGVSQNVRH